METLITIIYLFIKFGIMIAVLAWLVSLTNPKRKTKENQGSEEG